MAFLKEKWQWISVRAMALMAGTIALLTTAMLIINWHSASRIQTELDMALRSQNQYFQHAIERDLQRLESRQREISQSGPLLRLIFQPNFLSAREIQYNAQWLMRELEILRDTSDLIKDARIVARRRDGHAIMSGYPSLFRADDGVIAQYPGLEEQQQAYAIIGGEFRCAVKFPSYARLEDIEYIVEITLSNEAIQNLLNQVYIGKNGLMLLTNEQRSWHVENERWSQERNADVTAALAQSFTGGGSGHTITLGQKSYVAYREGLEQFDLSLLALYPSDVVWETLRLQQQWYWVILLLSAVVLGVMQIFLHRQIHKPIEKLIQAFEAVSRNQLDVRLSYDGKNEFSYLYRSFNATIENLQKSIRQTYEYKIAAQTAELKHLQAQINPHFLYNSLFVLYNMAQLEDLDSIMEFTRYLGNYYRFIYDATEPMIPLKDDFAQAHTYLQIQSIRLGTRLNIECSDVPEDWADVLIPKLTFQPIVENIFQHSFQGAGGVIRIRFLEEESRLHAIFEDSGRGMSQEALEALRKRLEIADEATSSGLINVHRRLHLSLNEASGLSLAPSELGGLSVTLTVSRQAERD